MQGEGVGLKPFPSVGQNLRGFCLGFSPLLPPQQDVDPGIKGAVPLQRSARAVRSPGRWTSPSPRCRVPRPCWAGRRGQAVLREDVLWSRRRSGLFVRQPEPTIEPGPGGMGQCGEQEGEKMENRRCRQRNMGWWGDVRENPGSARAAAAGRVRGAPTSPCPTEEEGGRSETDFKKKQPKSKQTNQKSNEEVLCFSWAPSGFLSTLVLQDMCFAVISWKLCSWRGPLCSASGLCRRWPRLPIPSPRLSFVLRILVCFSAQAPCWGLSWSVLQA